MYAASILVSVCYKLVIRFDLNRGVERGLASVLRRTFKSALPAVLVMLFLWTYLAALAAIADSFEGASMWWMGSFLVANAAAKTGGEYGLKLLLSSQSVKPGLSQAILFAFELCVSTRTRVLILRLDDWRRIGVASIILGLWEFLVRIAVVHKYKRDTKRTLELFTVTGETRHLKEHKAKALILVQNLNGDMVIEYVGVNAAASVLFFFANLEGYSINRGGAAITLYAVLLCVDAEWP